MAVRPPGYYGSWLHVDATLETGTDINLYNWIVDWTEREYGYRWDNTSKKLNAIITIPSGAIITASSINSPAILIDNNFRSFDRITLKINGKVIGGYVTKSYSFGIGSVNNLGVLRFSIPDASSSNGIVLASNVTSIGVGLVGGGGGGGTGNEKGNGGGGGGGGGGGYLSGYIPVAGGASVKLTMGKGGSGGKTSGPSSIIPGNDGKASIAETTVGTTVTVWTAHGGKGGKGGGNAGDCDGCASADNSGGSGGAVDTGDIRVLGGDGSPGGRGSKDTSDGSGGKGGSSASGTGGDGGDPGSDGKNGNDHGGGGGGGGFEDRTKGGRHNSGGDGARGYFDCNFPQTFLNGPGITLKNFIGYLKIDSMGGIIAGYPPLNGSPTEWGTKPLELEGSKVP